MMDDTGFGDILIDSRDMGEGNGQAALQRQDSVDAGNVEHQRVAADLDFSHGLAT